MVVFCVRCDTSLPLADVTIRNGSEFTSPDYLCPMCHQPAADPPPADPEDELGVDGETDLIVRDGRAVKP
ncbi:MAG: hypothetical protein HUU15_09345 [Candidatus Brocadiae bacterium]|nr:hypothetical protein [Candidatus Brocadiia bacterium]